MNITVTVQIDAPLEVVWACWITPEAIMKWNHASDDWHTPQVTNDLKKNGHFNYRMEAKDGSMGFDFEGTYTAIIPLSQIDYTLGDDRKVTVLFTTVDHKTEVTEIFEPETIHDLDLQRAGWLAILNNFKKYVDHKK